jgi:CRISPR-associated helicase cas3
LLPHEEWQSVGEHLDEVEAIAREAGGKIGLQNTASLAAYLHDAGKYTKAFKDYLVDSVFGRRQGKGPIHSTIGAKYLYETRYQSSRDPTEKLTAQLISLVICQHHGLCDCLSVDGEDKYTQKMETDKELFYGEAMGHYTAIYRSEEELERLFQAAYGEVEALCQKMQDRGLDGYFTIAMVQRFLLSAIIDGDYSSTYHFMSNTAPTPPVDPKSFWRQGVERLEDVLQEYGKRADQNPINRYRQKISEECRAFAKRGTGVYQLTVPTGGGKTESSIRFALEHAKEHGKDKIIYVIPYLSILEQNADRIRKILLSPECSEPEHYILEHHSNIIWERDEEADEDQTEREKAYRALTERYSSPVVFTTMVQFLETFFGQKKQSIRRMQSYANAVVIFDEVQSIPVNSISLFNGAVNFLSEVANTTVVLCTATQPELSRTRRPILLAAHPNMVENVTDTFQQFKRVQIKNCCTDAGYSVEAAADFILEASEQKDSLLAILNTRKEAGDVYRCIEKRLKQRGEDAYELYHLSNAMCPNHRRERLRMIKERLAEKRQQPDGKKLICVSTQLIEAGVDISFQCVVRALAGLDRIAQAAGRCNREGEIDCQDVYVIKLAEENLSNLKDIAYGKEATARIFDEFKRNPAMFGYDLLSPQAMAVFYQYYYQGREKEMDFAVPQRGSQAGFTVYDILSQNQVGRSAYEEWEDCDSELILSQAFQTAAREFYVIRQDAISVIVPYGDQGKAVIANLNGDCTLEEAKGFLAKAQPYTVDLYSHSVATLQRGDAIYPLLDGSVWVLKERYYDDQLGVVSEAGKMDMWSV